MLQLEGRERGQLHLQEMAIRSKNTVPLASWDYKHQDSCIMHHCNASVVVSVLAGMLLAAGGKEGVDARKRSVLHIQYR